MFFNMVSQPKSNLPARRLAICWHKNTSLHSWGPLEVSNACLFFNFVWKTEHPQNPPQVPTLAPMDKVPTWEPRGNRRYPPSPASRAPIGVGVNMTNLGWHVSESYPLAGLRLLGANMQRFDWHMLVSFKLLAEELTSQRSVYLSCRTSSLPKVAQTLHVRAHNLDGPDQAKHRI